VTTKEKSDRKRASAFMQSVGRKKARLESDAGKSDKENSDGDIDASDEEHCSNPDAGQEDVDVSSSDWERIYGDMDRSDEERNDGSDG